MPADAATHVKPAKTSAISSRWLAILLCIVTVAVLGRVCQHEFVDLDDPLTIANNPSFNPFGFTQLAHYFRAAEQDLYIPLTYTVWGSLSWIARVQQPDVFGSTLNPWIYHTTNLVIHLAATLVVFDILMRLSLNRAAACMGAAIFAIHPVQVETVAWASGTKDLLCGLFIAIAIDGLICFRHRDGASRKAWHACLIWIAILLACMSKPTGVVGAFMLLAIDLLVLRTPIRQSLRVIWPAVLLAVVFAIIGKIVQPPIAAHVPAWYDRPLIAGDALAFDLFKLAWPAHVCIDYGRTPERILALPATRWIWIVPLGIAICALFWRRRFPLIFAGVVLTTIGVAPVLGFIPFTFQAYSTVADHYLYPAMIGIAVITASLLDQTNAKPIASTAAMLLAGMLVAALASLSFIDAGYWSDSQSLFTHAIAVNPQSFLAYANRGGFELKRGDQAAAEADLRRAIAIQPDNAFAHLNLASLLMQENRPRDAAAEFREVGRVYATQRNFDPHLAATGQAAFAMLMANHGYTADAIELLKESIHRDPDDLLAKKLLDQLESRAPRPSTAAPAATPSAPATNRLP